MIIKKKKGGIQIFIAFYFFLCVVLLACLYLAARYFVNSELQYLKDGADLANISVYKYINQNELATTGNVSFYDSDITNVYETFKEYLAENLNLDADLRPINSSSFIQDQVSILDIRIYSVTDGLTTEYDLDTSTNTFVKTKDNVSTTLYTPNNKAVLHTSIYSKFDAKCYIFFKMYGIKDIPITSYTDALNIFK